jgi:hypothetical protein
LMIWNNSSFEVVHLKKRDMLHRGQ